MWVKEIILTFRELSSFEMDQLRAMFEDFKKLFPKENILASEIPDVIAELKTAEAQSFIQGLERLTKPETALSDAFFAGQSLLLRYLATDKSPEVNTGNGFIDFKIFSGNKFVLLELKPLFDTETKISNSGRKELVKLKQKKLDWNNYKEQILKYLKKDGEYIVITDLKDWYFFDETVTDKKFEPFFETTFEVLEKKFSEVENFYGLVERCKKDSLREKLDKEFFKDLKVWIDKLRTIDFDIDDNKKLEFVLGIINKFIFIQTLQDYSIIEYEWIQKRWKSTEDLWGHRYFEVLNQFFEDTIKWFFKSYDTELFVNNELNLLKKDEKNIKKLYTVFKTILGLGISGSSVVGQRGILQYDFKLMNEDIFGKAYETYLSEERHEKGIYYTPGYITQYIVENTVEKTFQEKVEQIKQKLDTEDFDSAKKYLAELIELKVIDPSCGSGSFLIKSFRIIWDKYLILSDAIDELIKKHDVYDTLTRKPEIEQMAKHLEELKKMLGFETKRDLISKLLLRHIYGNDIDPKAVGIAKVNLWLEAIKQSPKDFIYDKLPSHTNRILPYLDINLVNGDAVVGLDDDFVVDYLSNNHKEELAKISKLRLEYIEEPTKDGRVEKIIEEKKKLNDKLAKEFSKEITKKKLESSITKSLNPLHWPVDFWHFYFKDSKALPKSERGANFVVGNPPYVSKESMKKSSPDYVKYLNKADFKSTESGGKFDLAVIFIERGFNLLKSAGKFGYIVTNKFFLTEYGEGIRRLVSEKKAVKEIIDFADQQVFKDEATTYTTIITLENSTNDKFKYLRTKRLLETKAQLEIDSESYSPDTKMYFVNNSDLTSEGWCFLNEIDKKIVERTKSFKKLGGDAGVTDRIFQGLATGADPVFILNLIKEEDRVVKAFSKALNKEVILEKELTRPLLKGADIKKWDISGYDDIIIFPYVIKDDHGEFIEEKVLKTKYPKIYEYFVSNKDALESRENEKWKGVQDWYAYGRRQNIEQFDQNKIMTQVLANKAAFALDKGNMYYFVGGGNAGGYGISIRKDAKISLECLIALLNSSFFDWRHHQCASRFDRGFYSYGQMYIQDLPIKSFNEKSGAGSELEQLISKIMQNKNELKKFSEMWKHWCKQMNDAERDMKQILLTEEENIKDGDQKNIWFDEISFFISKNKELMEREYDSFKVTGDFETSSIKVFGVKELQDELIFELVLKDELLIDHFYLALNEGTKSIVRSKVKSLDVLFEKTIIPVLQPNPATKTRNLMTKVFDEYSKVSSNKSGIVKMEDEIKESEAKIDSIVFKEYGVTKEEANYIMDDLMLPDRYKVQVNKHLA